MPPGPGNTKKNSFDDVAVLVAVTQDISTDSPEYNSPSLSIAFHSPYYEQDRDAPNKNTNHQNKAIFSGQVSKEFLATCHVFCKKINVNVTLTQLQGMRSVN